MPVNVQKALAIIFMQEVLEVQNQAHMKLRFCAKMSASNLSQYWDVPFLQKRGTAQNHLKQY